MPIDSENLYFSSQYVDTFIERHNKSVSESEFLYPRKVLLLRSLVRTIIIAMFCAAAFLMYMGIKANNDNTKSVKRASVDKTHFFIPEFSTIEKNYSCFVIQRAIPFLNAQLESTTKLKNNFSSYSEGKQRFQSFS